MNRVSKSLIALGLALLIAAPLTVVRAQETTWMSVGSLHNWYSSVGSEIEEGRIKEQQDGLQWPAIYSYQDIQAAKALWIATTNYDDGTTVYIYKVVHVGPRVDGRSEFFPQKFELVSKTAPPVVTVDGSPSVGKVVTIARLDPTIPGDRIINNVVNTAIGITMTRKIFQFTQQFHDNYIVSDYVFKNNSGKTLTGVYFYYHYRLAVCADTRYVIGNATGWGINSMLDTRGDGVKNDADDYEVAGNSTTPHMRIQYIWHGKYPLWTTYDNIGGPIWKPYYDNADSVGRLGAAQFAGVVTLHADKSAADKSNDPGQPSTTSWEGSDEPNTSQNDQFNKTKMASEYGWVSKGHANPRHADKVEPTGSFDSPTSDPALGTPGGFSNANGYGPYTLAPGDSIHLVIAEGVSGLSREKCISIGRRYKLGQINAVAKNDSVLTGKDSLFQTFRRAIANFKSNWALPLPPDPPKSFTITSGGDKVSLTWDVYNPADPKLKGFQIYRAAGRYDGQYTLIQSAGPADRSYDDLAVTRGVANFYYIVSVGDPADNNGAAGTPAGVALTSNRLYTQTYDPAFLKRAAGNANGPNAMDSIRIVPNPFSLSSSLRFQDEADKLAFYNIPGYCKIRIYTELGELIKEFDHNDGSGDHYWKSVTSSGQVVVSGIYIVVIDNLRTGQRVMKKFAVVR
jgi:hypothetical protein